MPSLWLQHLKATQELHSADLRVVCSACSCLQEAFRAYGLPTASEQLLHTAKPSFKSTISSTGLHPSTCPPLSVLLDSYQHVFSPPTPQIPHSPPPPQKYFHSLQFSTLRCGRSIELSAASFTLPHPHKP